jgi:hypothetical protein
MVSDAASVTMIDGALPETVDEMLPHSGKIVGWPVARLHE